MIVAFLLIRWVFFPLLLLVRLPSRTKTLTNQICSVALLLLLLNASMGTKCLLQQIRKGVSNGDSPLRPPGHVCHLRGRCAKGAISTTELLHLEVSRNIVLRICFVSKELIPFRLPSEVPALPRNVLLDETKNIPWVVLLMRPTASLGWFCL